MMEKTPTRREHWRCRHIANERNIIELARTLESSAPAVGVVMSGNNSNNPALYPLTFRRYLARENIVRHFEGASDLNRVDGVSTNNCEKGIVQHNLVAVNSQTQPEWRLTNTFNGQLAFVDNQRAAGVPIKPFKNTPPPAVFTDDLFRDAIEDATTLGFL